MILVFALLIIYQLKHFLCDYPLQTQYMLGKFKPGRDWILPLAAHACVHAGFTFVIALIFSPAWLAILLSFLDFTAHLTVDRAKVVKGNYPQTDKRFWWALGLDQMAHHFTDYLIIVLILLGR